MSKPADSTYMQILNQIKRQSNKTPMVPNKSFQIAKSQMIKPQSPVRNKENIPPVSDMFRQKIPNKLSTSPIYLFNQKILLNKSSLLKKNTQSDASTKASFKLGSNKRIVKEKGNLPSSTIPPKVGVIKINRLLTADNDRNFLSTASESNHIDVYEDFRTNCETERSENITDYTQRKEQVITHKRISAKKRLDLAKKHLIGPEVCLNGYGMSFYDRDELESPRGFDSSRNNRQSSNTRAIQSLGLDNLSPNSASRPSPERFFLGRQLSDRIKSIEQSIQKKNSPYSTSRDTIDYIVKDRISNSTFQTEQTGRISTLSEASRLNSLYTGGFDHNLSLYQKRIASIALSNHRVALGSNMNEAEVRAQESPFASIKGYSGYLNAHYS